VPRASVVMHRRVLKKIRNKQLPTLEIAQCLGQLTDGNSSAKGLGMKRLKGIVKADVANALSFTRSSAINETNITIR